MDVQAMAIGISPGKWVKLAPDVHIIDTQTHTHTHTHIHTYTHTHIHTYMICTGDGNWY